MDTQFVTEHIAETLPGKRVPLGDLRRMPVVDAYEADCATLLETRGERCLAYYGNKENGRSVFRCVVANDETGMVKILSQEHAKSWPKSMGSIAQRVPGMHLFEREMQENFGIQFEGHPWPKPLRYAFDRADQAAKMADFPFYKIDSNELHEVGVGPIHAGVIEPGHFRFLCNGETVLNLEIQLGWQHRGVEALMRNKESLLARTVLAESISGDTAIGHATAQVQTMEGLAEIEISDSLHLERAIALELERIAIHVGDLSAMCTDVAYQLGSATFGALRTPIINFLQSWCGNRFGKGLVRAGGSHYPLKANLKNALQKMLADFKAQFSLVAEHTFNLSSVQKRFEGIGTITTAQAKTLGAAGMAARMAGLRRDARWSHPSRAYQMVEVEPIVLDTGDVWARGMLRKLEIEQSISLILEMLPLHTPTSETPLRNLSLKPDSWICTLTEGWRGEIVHCAGTDAQGNLQHYKIKDPSFHNWVALELSLRDLEISDFPINNKSYDLSYCGFDL
ncbi:MAG TPA: NADH dehydrogenase subunit [Bacteroidetes bacterium]|nr:NADH dehydrogenase subunit [Bacteroidota bacterium]